MPGTKLFVRSTKSNIVIGYNAGSYYTRAHSLVRTEYKLSPKDEQARNLLSKSGIGFELVDLSRGRMAGLTARIRGVKETPMLKIEEGSVKKLVGLNAISDYVEKGRQQSDI